MRRSCQCSGEVAPLINGAQRIMQQDERSTLAVPYAPLANEDASTWNFYERVERFDTHRETVRVPRVAMLATLIRKSAAAATSAQIVKFMAAEWCAMDARV